MTKYVTVLLVLHVQIFYTRKAGNAIGYMLFIINIININCISFVDPWPIMNTDKWKKWTFSFHHVWPPRVGRSSTSFRTIYTGGFFAKKPTSPQSLFNFRPPRRCGGRAPPTRVAVQRLWKWYTYIICSRRATRSTVI